MLWYVDKHITCLFLEKVPRLWDGLEIVQFIMWTPSETIITTVAMYVNNSILVSNSILQAIQASNSNITS